MRRKVKHSGEGLPVRDRSGWLLGPGDPAVFLPRAADATVLAAVESGRLVYVDAAEPAVSDAEKPKPEIEETKDNRNLLIVIMKLAIDSLKGLTSTGKPKIDYLREEMEVEGGDPDFVTSEVRDEIFDEINVNDN
jgi:hypothetical protein